MDDLGIFILILCLIIIALITMRLTGIYKKDKCPECSGRLSRKNRTLGDRMLIVLTFGILPLRRYKCVHCGWGGLRWNNKKRKKKSKSGEQSVPLGHDESLSDSLSE